MFSGSVKSKEEIWNDVKRLIDYGTEEEQQQAIKVATEQRKASVQQNEPVSGSDEGNVFVYSFFFVWSYKYNKRQRIYPCLYAQSFKNHIDTQMTILTTPVLEHYYLFPIRCITLSLKV